MDFQFEVRNQANELVPPNGLLKEVIATRDESIHAGEILQPGQGRRYFLNLSKLYDFKRGQTYQLSVSRRVRSQAGTALKLTSSISQSIFL
jgi:hypothetical protein